MMPTEPPAPAVLLFDLGNVVVESAGLATLERLLPQLGREEILSRWLRSGAVSGFESGALSQEAFARAFLAEWPLPMAPAQFLDEFTSWVRGFLPGARELLAGLRSRHRIACLSNTNALHWARLDGIEDVFDVCIASHLTGFLKPDREAYEDALARLGAEPEQVCFFDDLPGNVAAAREVGMQAFQVRGVAETASTLRALGIAAGRGGNVHDRTHSGAGVAALYERHARRYDRDRGRGLQEKAWLDRFLGHVRPAGTVLDIGCGMGEPIARYVIEAGFGVVGVDSSPSLIALCRARFPGAEWRVGDMRELALGRRFEGLVAWDSFFHLEAADQRAMFPRFAAHAQPGAPLLFTSGPAHGESIGEFIGMYGGGEPLYHASLDPAEYRQLLSAHGFRELSHVAQDPDCGGHTVWLADYRP